MSTKTKAALNTVSYTLLNFRYGSLILPVGVVAYLLGLPGWLAIAACFLLGAAVGAELVTSVINGLTTAQLLQHQAQEEADMWADLERFVNGDHDGSEGEAGPEGEASEGEDPSGEGEGEGFRPVR